MSGSRAPPWATFLERLDPQRDFSAGWTRASVSHEGPIPEQDTQEHGATGIYITPSQLSAPGLFPVKPA